MEGIGGMADDDGRFFINKRTDRTYISKRIDNPDGTGIRIISELIDGNLDEHFAKVKDELVIRRTGKKRFEIKATVNEDDRQIVVLTLQQWSVERGYPLERTHFSFVGAEVQRLLEFVERVRTVHLDKPSRMAPDIGTLTKITMTQAQATAFLGNNPSLVIDAATNNITQQDIVALAFRKKQLVRFNKLLTDPNAFELEQEGIRGPEAVWQRFFEQNPWIFGYGLSYVFTSGLEGRTLEQVVSGFDITRHGKRADALLKSHAAVSALCFVEIKHHGTELLRSSAYRPGTWAASAELGGGVSQCHETVRAAAQSIGERLKVTDELGNPTGEEHFNFEPRSILIIGSLAQFQTENGPNAQKFRCFESFRRNLKSPEIVTFDELYERAKFIVDNQTVFAKRG